MLSQPEELLLELLVDEPPVDENGTLVADHEFVLEELFPSKLT